MTAYACRRNFGLLNFTSNFMITLFQVFKCVILIHSKPFGYALLILIAEVQTDKMVQSLLAKRHSSTSLNLGHN